MNVLEKFGLSIALLLAMSLLITVLVVIPLTLIEIVYGSYVSMSVALVAAFSLIWVLISIEENQSDKDNKNGDNTD